MDDMNMRPADFAAVMNNGDYSGRHYVRGHYSREDGKEHMIEKLRMMMEDAEDQHQKNVIGDCINRLNSQR